MSNWDKGDRLLVSLSSTELAKRINVKETGVFIIGAILAVSDKFLSEEYKSKVLEVLDMTEMHISPLLVNKVMAIYDIKKLNRVFEGAAKGSSIEDVEKLLN